MKSESKQQTKCQTNCGREAMLRPAEVKLRQRGIPKLGNEAERRGRHKPVPAATPAVKQSFNLAGACPSPQLRQAVKKVILMTERVPPGRHGSYGIDAPYAPAFMAVVIVVELVMAIISGRWQTFVPITFLLAVLGFYLHSTLRGKFVVWADLLDQLQLRGDERILDMGCGRGAVLLMAAQCLTTGRAAGVDLWRRVDQSGNSLEATRRNSIAEGVADRVELHTGDMTALPFADNSFDLVVSSLAIHNISGSAGREKAISEAVRVLRPGGRLLIADIRATRRYAAHLARLGMSEVTRRWLGWRFWWWAPARLVTATKLECRN